MKIEDKRGQVTIFVIIGILIVSVILVFVLYVQPDFISDGIGRLSFEDCVQDAVEVSIASLGEKGGFSGSPFSYPNDGKRYSYLCYTNEFYDTCTIQVPFLKQHFEENLDRSLREPINLCYTNAVSDLRGRGYDVTSGDVNYEVSLEPGLVIVEIDAPTTVGGSSFQRFNIRFDSPIYNMLTIATSILQFESELGDTNLDSIRAFYPEIFVNKLKQDQGTTIYLMRDKATGQEFNFASRSLAWPAGYDV